MSVRRVGARFFTTPIRAGKLKNWKSEKLTSRQATGSTRISGFQDFRFSLTPVPGRRVVLNDDFGGELPFPGHRKHS
jgi:hypothetical protein